MKLDKVNWGIIGCGDVTELKSGPAFSKVKKSKLISVMRRNGEAVKDYAARHNVPKWTTDASELINDPDVNAVYIATPPAYHAPYAIEAMKAGKPVYVEKPMATTYRECLEMNRVSGETGVSLYVAYYRRTLPGFLKVKEIVDSGTLGNILYVNIELMRPPTKDEKDNSAWRVDPELAGGGIFYDLASHQLDYFDFLFGPVKEVSGKAFNKGGLYQAEDTVVASMVYENGVVCNGTWCFVTSEDTKKDTIEIAGTKGCLEFSSFGHTPLILHKNGSTEKITYELPENIQYCLIKQIVEKLTGNGECVSTGETAAGTNKVMEVIVSGYYK